MNAEVVTCGIKNKVQRMRRMLKELLQNEIVNRKL